MESSESVVRIGKRENGNYCGTAVRCVHVNLSSSRLLLEKYSISLNSSYRGCYAIIIFMSCKWSRLEQWLPDVFVRFPFVVKQAYDYTLSVPHKTQKFKAEENAAKKSSTGDEIDKYYVQFKINTGIWALETFLILRNCDIFCMHIWY